MRYSALSPDEALVAASAEDLRSDAFDFARATHGWTLTYSPKVFIPLTQLCQDRCGYCTFAQAPARLTAPYMNDDEVLAVARAGKAAGVAEALFTLGERPELRYEEARRWLADRGFASTVDYVVHAAQLVLTETGLLPHVNAGALYEDELARVRQVSASQGMMIETLADVPAHRLAPDKDPERRLATLEAAGRLAIPFTTGILVGIGESRQDRIDAIRAIAAAHVRHGHVQEVIVQNFMPKSGTAMAKDAPPSDEEYRWSIAMARLLLPTDVHLQAPPNLSDRPTELVAYGIDDFGGISPVTRDHVNPERAWPAVATLADGVAPLGFHLVPRLTVYPSFVGLDSTYVDANVRPHVLALADAGNLLRDDAWVSGGADAPAPLVGRTGVVTSPVQEILRRYEPGVDLRRDELETLFAARGGDIAAIAAVANETRRALVGDDVTYVVNRNINYTNVCTFKCRFCAFSKGPLSLNLRGDPYLLTLDDITERVREAAERGATEVCLQGGIHPKFDGEYYIDVVAAVRVGSPNMHIHAFSALEVFEGARRSGQELSTYLTRLRDAGLKTLPGTAAEILHDDIRAILCPDKLTTQQWLEVHHTAHQVGLRSNITVMFGAIEDPSYWVEHLLVTKELQRRTGGFTEFVPLPFVHMATPMFLQGKGKRGPTFRETLLMHAIARLHYATLIDNIQVSWVKVGVEGARQILQAGANDVGGTLMDENISRAAGAVHGQAMDVAMLESLVAPLGRPLVQRSTLYGALGR